MTRRYTLSPKQMRETAERALAYMREHDQDPGRGFGYAWSALSTIAGTPQLPLPSEERMAALNAAKVRP